jgi:pimeloyl-ACP methyl ester carboxylesterase
MGGGLCSGSPSEHPDRVRRLMLFDSAGLYAKPDWDTALFTSTTPEQLKQFYALLMPIPPNVPPFVARDILRITKERSWITQRAMGSMLSGRDVTDSLLPRLKMPVLIVWGQADRITPLSLGEKIHELIPQSQLEVIPGCGHLAPSQCAAQIGPRVVEFVKQ